MTDADDFDASPPMERGADTLSETQAARLLATAALQTALLLTDPRRPDNPIIYHNRAFERLTGYSSAEIEGRNCRFLQGPETDPADVAAIRRAVRDARPARVTLLNYRKDGTPFWNELTLTPLFNGAGELSHWAGLQTDVTALRDTEATLRESHARVSEVEQRLRLALESGGLGLWDLDIGTGRYLTMSAIWKTQFGLPPETDPGEFSQEDFLRLLHPEDRDRVHGIFELALKNRTDYLAEYRCLWPDGSLHWIRSHGRLLYDGAGRPDRMIGVTQEITAQKLWEAEQERALVEARDGADRDSLTGLFNHRAFHRRLAEETARAARDGTALAAVMLDLDNFKFFNDAYGHAVGDDVLRQVAAKLQGVCRPYDTLARFGGDEFALLLPGVGEAAYAEVEARLRADLGRLVFQPDGQDSAIPLTVSIGAALFPRETRERADLMGLADERLLRAKTGGSVTAQAAHVRHALNAEVDGFSMLDALVTAVDNKDRYTRRHSEDVMEHALMIAQELGWGEDERHALAVAALLHDVGKIGVPDAILRKPGKLTDEEFTAVKRHPQMGAVMVSSVAGLEATLDAVRHHHERWDGHGYPSGLRGEETPLIARLMAVADAFSAMTTDRPYRKGMDRQSAVAILRAGAGTQWDPQCVGAFLAALARVFPLPSVV